VQLTNVFDCFGVNLRSCTVLAYHRLEQVNDLNNESPTNRQPILKMSISIDGFVAGPNGELDWLFATGDDGSASWSLATISSAGVHIMGQKTYQTMAAYWPTSTLPFAAPMNEIPKVIFSRRIEKTASAIRLTTIAANPQTYANWLHPERAGSDLVRDIEELKGRPGGYILAHGGASFAQSLVAADLIDEYRLAVHPVALGRGLPFFSTLASTLFLELTEVKSFKAGVVAKRYVRVRQSA
jgi:dihydrofolate reductase